MVVGFARPPSTRPVSSVVATTATTASASLVPFAFATVAALVQPLVGHVLGAPASRQPAGEARRHRAGGPRPRTEPAPASAGCSSTASARWAIEIPRPRLAHQPQPGTGAVPGLDESPSTSARTTRPRAVRPGRPAMVLWSFQSMVAIGFGLIGDRGLPVGPAWATGGEPPVPAAGGLAGGGRAGPRARLDHHRGRSPAVDRPGGDADRRGRDRAAGSYGCRFSCSSSSTPPCSSARRSCSGRWRATLAGGRDARPPDAVRARRASTADEPPRRRAPRCCSSACSRYGVLGGADFGSGCWDLTAGDDERGGRCAR